MTPTTLSTAMQEAAQMPREIWVVIDEQGQPCYSAGWPEACHEHINDAIAEHDLPEASTWVVRRYVPEAVAALGTDGGKHE